MKTGPIQTFKYSVSDDYDIEAIQSDPLTLSCIEVKHKWDDGKKWYVVTTIECCDHWFD